MPSPRSPFRVLCNDIAWNSLALIAPLIAISAWTAPAEADGIARPPRNYKGSLEESSQEAIIIFQEGKRAGESVEDLILKITLQGSPTNFAWVIPFPQEPKVAKEEPQLFVELFDYVQAQRARGKTGQDAATEAVKTESVAAAGVKVLSRQTVGSFDVAVVKETAAGTLNEWLDKEGYQKIERADDLLTYYRERGYVYACIKFTADALREGREIETHPLRFTFPTGGRDGVYFPMKLSAAQTEPFDVNLYVFYRYWLNDKLSRYGYNHRGFLLVHRDWDTPQCEANGGKAWTDPVNDPLLKSVAHRIPTVTKLMQKLHPGERYYLTNIQARALKPANVRDWRGDLWLFPYYTDRRMVPHDARTEGPARHVYPDVDVNDDGLDVSVSSGWPYWPWAAGIGGGAAVLAGLWSLRVIKLRRRTPVAA